jgi:hypothetical protein
VAAISDRGVLDDGMPVVFVIHYSEDESWAFLSGEAFSPDRGLLVSMGNVVRRDPSLLSIADLPPGWVATRDSADGRWLRREDPDV